MPTEAIKKHFTFTGGLNTEASPLTFPENTWSEGDNVIPSIDGSITLRRGIDYEESYELSALASSLSSAATGAFGSVYWNNVSGNGNINFIAIQKGRTVEFYDNNGVGISSQLRDFTIDLADYHAAGNTNAPGVALISGSNVNGALLLVSRDIDPILVEYDEDTDTITVTVITIAIRDFQGVDDGLDVDERPAALSATHQYNLLNQGWNATNYGSYHTSTSLYPSNAQVWTEGKDSSDVFQPSLLDKQDFGTTPAPKGRFVLDLFDQDRDAAAGTSGVTTITELFRPTTSAFYAGRAWYAGMKSSRIGTWVLFSQVAEDTTKLGKCYQDADPTSETISDLIATDGGVIPIQNAGTVLKLMPWKNSLLVLCNNGVWQIVPGNTNGFAADSYEVRQLTTNGTLNATSVVVTDQGVMWWGEEGIYMLLLNGQTGEPQVVSITLGVVQTLYDDIPTMGKLFSHGTYVPDEAVVYWTYNNDEDQNGVIKRFKKTSLLCLDMTLRAFYTMSIGELATDSPYIVDSFITKNRGESDIVDNVVEDQAGVLVEAGAVQVVATLTPEVTATPIKLLFYTVVPNGMGGVNTTFSEFVQNEDNAYKFRDWYIKNTAGVTFLGTVVPGYDFGQDQGAVKPIQALYVWTYFRRTETGVDAGGNPLNPSSCLMRGRWDWADSNAGGKWSTAYQVYRHRRLWIAPTIPASDYDDGYPVVVTKNKVRGRGKALQLALTSEADKDMQVLGWAIDYIGNSKS